MVCHGNLATRAEEVKTEIAVIFLHLRISTLYSPCSPPPKHTFWFLQVVVHWIKSFIYFNDLVFDNFYLWRIKGITYWVWNFRASVGTSLIKTLSLLCITQVLPTPYNFPSECETYIDNERFPYRSIALEGHNQFHDRSVLLLNGSRLCQDDRCAAALKGTTIGPSYGSFSRSSKFWFNI